MDHSGDIDNVFAHYQERVSGFVFDDKVASVFDDMIRRSVPGYATVLGMVHVFAEHFAQPNSNCYDLGCSLGGGTIAMLRGIKQSGCKVIAIDNSPAMLARCEQILQNEKSKTDVQLVEADVADMTFENASVVVCNYTLQFLDTTGREELIERIYEGMLPGGVLILSEKIKFENTQEQEFFTDIYHDFKRLQGYSDLEISQKRKALENVLVPDSTETHLQRLKNAGFSRIHQWFQCVNFVSFAAFK
ncbi:tRNA (cmo5U34)-methyltransferase [Anaerohalosphaera lusitana]|uniref:Carboxy-S-adenosyl-L-methionine synthase n=1 Tax=Anaerohalosphaera lusitana TaxID=1936003 RepID=A0A1U9NP64_9BACT|nr:carboxy-S-adenosyl-L-methionine synthase CmoA [Anaerohalosphaera lusitana]AQT69732.1 tRNA (cmo5U34)-methyltransferase [Anaerohalosphaera lusitana]